MSDGDDDRPPRPLIGPAFWIAILFGLVCIAAGLAVARLGPHLLQPAAPHALGKTGPAR
jgi:hypothetical protein